MSEVGNGVPGLHVDCDSTAINASSIVITEATVTPFRGDDHGCIWILQSKFSGLGCPDWITSQVENNIHA